jgi:hypothetical protein
MTARFLPEISILPQDTEPVNPVDVDFGGPQALNGG